ncbi:hypothetical protein ASG82_22270 [Mycobacterium sp. Soil538]|nr:hypothetical protein ASG82_22270 [Mycobacterium sp. Soil538]
MGFVRLLRDEWALYENDVDSFRLRPEAQAYFRWFRDIRSVRYEPSLLRDAKRMNSAFLARMDQTARLWQSMSRDGYDISAPIRLASGRTLERVNGKAVNEIVFSGDGCHRIACLQLLGWKHLKPVHYEVALYPRFTPLDITSILIEMGMLDRETYRRYLCEFYGQGTNVKSFEGLEHYLASASPALLEELQSVLTYDLAKFEHREGMQGG